MSWRTVVIAHRAKLDYQLGAVRCCKKKLIVFVQIGRYFTPEQRTQLQATAAHHDIALLFIETQELDYANHIPRYIIDADGCEI
ncbi:MAG: type II-A CRISPR-associated protein Csn2 [Peptococcaceae bacterium]|nr:type II-A CRISPR-associated protein Csn2 [Peptococcaceae bacterium]